MAGLLGYADRKQYEMMREGMGQRDQLNYQTQDNLFKRSLQGSMMAPGAGILDASGYFPNPDNPSQFLPSMKENWNTGHPWQAGFQALGAAGDAAMVVPPLGMALKGLGALGSLGVASRVLGHGADVKNAGKFNQAGSIGGWGGAESLEKRAQDTANNVFPPRPLVDQAGNRLPNPREWVGSQELVGPRMNDTDSRFVSASDTELLDRMDAAAKASKSAFDKQYPIAKAYELGAAKDPRYQQSVFSAYQANPVYASLMKQHNIQSYDELVEKSYGELKKEIKRQFDALPIEVDWYKSYADDYPSSGAMTEDVTKNNHMKVFQGGDEHPQLGEMADTANGLSYNDMFRAVHDYVGHSINKAQFGPHGEEIAYKQHWLTLEDNPLAQVALASETRGQNSLVNYSGINKEVFDIRERLLKEKNKTRDPAMKAEWDQRIKKAMEDFNYAPQESVMLPPEMLGVDYGGDVPGYVQGILKQDAAGVGVKQKAKHYTNLKNVDEIMSQGLLIDKQGSGIGRGRDTANRGVNNINLYDQATEKERMFSGAAEVRADLDNIYDINQDPMGLNELALSNSRSSYGAKVNPGTIDNTAKQRNLDKALETYGFAGYNTGNVGQYPNTAYSRENIPPEALSVSEGGKEMMGPYIDPNKPKGLLGETGRIDFPTSLKSTKGEPVKAINQMRASKPSKPITAYHSTDADFTEFDPEKGIGGQMWFTSRKDLAEAGYDGSQGGRLVDAQIDIRNPAGREEYEKYGIDELMGKGYDGIALVEGDETVYVAFFPEQVKINANKSVK